MTIPPFQTIHVSGLTECIQHFKRVNVIVEPDHDKDYKSVIPIHGYTVLKPRYSHVSIGLRNQSCRRVTVQAKSIVAKVSAANVVPHSLAPNLNNEDMFKQFKKYQDQLQSCKTTDQSILETDDPPKLSPEKENLLFSIIDLSGAKDWEFELINDAKQLFHIYAHIFALESSGMGYTSIVKHKIRLDNYTPFKERYHRISPNLYEEVKNHLKEMIEVGTIHK